MRTSTLWTTTEQLHGVGLNTRARELGIPYFMLTRTTIRPSSEMSLPMVDLRNLTFQEYPNLCVDDPDLSDVPLFRWDNYLTIYHELHHGLIDEWIFSTHQIGTKPSFSATHIQPDDLLGFLDRQNSSRNWILNLDLDFFRSQYGDRYSQQNRVELMKAIKHVHGSSDKSVVTVALSPECCGGWGSGGWDSSEEFCEEFCRIFGLPFSLPYALQIEETKL
jgi:hypothetical protein